MSRRLLVEIVGDDKLSGSLGRASIATGGLGSKLGGLAKAAGFALGTAALGGLAFVLDDSVKAAIAAQTSQASLNAALKATGQSVSGMTPMLDAAQTAARNLGFADDDTRDSLGKLEIATGNTKKAISDLGVAENLARFKHISLTAASQTLAQALTGSQRAVKQLGISITPVTTAENKLKLQHVDLSTAAGMAAEAHAKLQDKLATSKEIIAAVTDKVNGQAKAFAGTAAGGLAQFKAQLGHLEEQLGNALLPVMENVLHWVNSHWPQIEQVFRAVFAGVAATVKTLVPIVGEIVSDFVDFGKAIATFLNALGPLKPVIEGIVLAIGAWEIAQIALDAAMDANPIGLIITGIAALVLAVVELIKHFGDVEQAFSDAFNAIANLAGTVATDVVNAFSPLVDTLGGFFTSIGTAVASVWNAISGTAKTAVTAVTGFFTGLPGDISGAISGIAGWVTKNVWDKISSAATGLITDIGGFFGGLPGDIHTAISGIAGWIKKNVWDTISSDASGLVGDVVGFFKGMPGAIAGFAESVGTTFVNKLVDGLSALGKALLTAIKAPINAVISAWDAIGFSVTLPSIKVPLVGTIGGGHLSFEVPQIPHLDTGGFIAQTGIAMVHKGEHVVPRGGALMGAGGGGMTFIFQPGAISGFIGDEAALADKLIDQINRKALGGGGIIRQRAIAVGR